MSKKTQRYQIGGRRKKNIPTWTYQVGSPRKKTYQNEMIWYPHPLPPPTPVSVAGKIYSMLLLDPLQARLEKVVTDSQSGFRKGRSTTDHLFTLQQVLHEAWEFDKPAHTCFIDLRKAYDTVNRPALWGVLEHIGISSKILRLIKDLHTGTRSSVRVRGRKSKPFEVNRGVRQGCILAPGLFNIFLDHVLRIALDECEGGVKIRYKIDGENYCRSERD